MTKAKFTSHGADSVTVEYTDLMTDLDECRTFTRQGKYVYELIGNNGATRQICDKLSSRGSTLMCYEGSDLTDKIRAEYRKMRQAAKKELSNV